MMMALKDKGFSYKTIGQAMDALGVDSQINNAKSNAYSSAFENAVNKGDYKGASIALGNLASVDKQKAAAYMSMFPTFKNAWDVLVNRQNAATAHGYDKENMLSRAQLQQALQDQRAQAQAAAKKAQQDRIYAALKAANWSDADAIAKAYGGVSPRGNSNSGPSDGTGTGAGEKVTKADVENARTMKQLGDRIAYALKNPDADNPDEERGKLVEEYTKKAQELADSGKFDSEDADFYLSMAAFYEGVRHKANGNNAMAEKMFSYMSPQAKARIENELSGLLGMYNISLDG